MKTLFAFLKLIRFLNLSILAFVLSLFYFLLLIPAHKYKLHTTLLPFTRVEFVLFVLSVLLIAAAGSTIYDYYSFESDKEYQPDRPLAQAAFSLDTALYLHAVFAFVGIGIGFYLGYSVGNFKIGYLYVIAVVVLYVYAAYLKKIPLAGNFAIAALMSFPIVLLMLFEATFLNTISFDDSGYVFNMLLWQVKFYGGFIFLIVMAIEIVKDLVNKDGDEATKVNTLVVQFGEIAGKIAATLTLLILAAALAYFMQLFYAENATKEFVYLLLAVVLPVVGVIALLFLAKGKMQYKRINMFLKIIMVLGILSLPAFYLFNK